MWKRNVNRYRRNKRSKKLEEKLFWIDKVYSELLIQHKTLCFDIERIRFIDLPSSPEGFTLQGFNELQKKRQSELRNTLGSIGQMLRDNINTYIRQIMDELREKIVSDIASEKHVVKGAPGNLGPPGRPVCALYEKLGFPENMSFGQRSLLRKECSRFLRFSYLADFYVLESLYKIYVWSCEELVERISDLVKMFNSQEVKAKRLKHNNPLFVLSLTVTPVPIPNKDKVMVDVYEFALPPHGKSQVDDFYPPLHLSLAPESGEDTSLPMDSDEPIGKRPTAPNILDLWLKVTPKLETLVEKLIDIVADGIDSILVIER